MTRELQTYLGWLKDFHWALQIFSVVFLTLFLDLVLKKLLVRLEKNLTERTATKWDEALVRAMQRPISILVWVIGSSFAVELVGDVTPAAIFQAIPPLRTVAVITIFTWFAVRFTAEIEKILLEKPRGPDSAWDDGTLQSIAKLVRLAVMITGVLVGVQTLGINISGLLAFGGIGGIAVGFAAKDLLANFFGGMMIHLDRPFAVGDWISSPDRQIEGTVEHISWRLTRIRKFDSRPIYIPNAAFSTITLENPSRMQNRRIYETIGIRYADGAKMGAIVEDVTTMLREHPAIDTNRTLMVNFNAFAPSSLDFFIYTFTKTTVWAEFHAIKQDVLLKVMEIIEGHGAEIAFPTSTIHMRHAPEPEPEVPADRDGK